MGERLPTCDQKDHSAGGWTCDSQVAVGFEGLGIDLGVGGAGQW